MHVYNILYTCIFIPSPNQKKIKANLPFQVTSHPPKKTSRRFHVKKRREKKILKTSVHTKPTSKTQASSSGTLESNGQSSPKTTPSENDHMVGDSTHASFPLSTL